jgi:hypothetical protein
MKFFYILDSWWPVVFQWESAEHLRTVMRVSEYSWTVIDWWW